MSFRYFLLKNVSLKKIQDLCNKMWLSVRMSLGTERRRENVTRLVDKQLLNKPAFCQCAHVLLIDCWMLSVQLTVTEIGSLSVELKTESSWTGTFVWWYIMTLIST